MHLLNRPDPSPAGDGDLTAGDWVILDRVEQALSRGRALQEWWQRTDARRSYPEVYQLERIFNRPDRSFGFFGETEVDGSAMRLMGNVQELFYDQVRVPSAFSRDATEWLRRQLREFVLRYFMRVADFREPEAYAETGRPGPSRFLHPLSWCPEEEFRREGFGFSQLYFKRRDTGRIGKFPADRQFAIIDLREIGPVYEWIVARVRIFDFTFRVRLFGEHGPELVFGLNEESHLVISPEFIVDDHPGDPHAPGEYGFGYAFLRSPEAGVIAYGPGQFDAAFEWIRFRITEDGVVRVHMAFVANRPAHIARISINPIDWGFRFADLATLGAASRVLAPLKLLLDRTPFSRGSFDPVYAYVGLANGLTGGAAARELCISRDQLDKDFLVQHFRQHYQTAIGSLLTWRQIPDWLDAAALPDWVVSGTSP